MNQGYSDHTTGIRGLDMVLKGILPGDNIVWEVDEIEDYKAIVIPYCEAARDAGRKLVYFRFADHEQLLPDDFGAEIHRFDPSEGFETFTTNIHAVIEEAGWGVYYVFDCLSGLAESWYSDQMLGNFFMLTCPYLFDLETITYFALTRNFHTNNAITPIRDTTQLFLDVYRHEETLYVRPLKVQHRYSLTMSMLHARKGDNFVPVSSSAIISEILTSSRWSGLLSDRSLGFWQTAFRKAEDFLQSKDNSEDHSDHQLHFEKLLNMVISRDDTMLKLLRKYFTLDQILDIKKRMIGTGLIGGKAIGMLLARAILKKENERCAKLLEAHDSFFIGSDVFYTFLVQNGLWFERQRQRDPEHFLKGALLARRRILTGNFPDPILEQFGDMLDYFGPSPFIVRSSSLLEDNFGNAFAGKYESVFCVNQGPRAQRLEDFLAAIRTIYASTMSEKALIYRSKRGLLERDEQMSLLVMRVSGAKYEHCFYPQMAGVGFSFNPYVWHKDIDPKAGVMRLVYGLGTRAVNRSDDDYTRIVALNAPEKRPESNFNEIAQYAQRKVDYLALEANQLVSGNFYELVRENHDLPIEKFSSIDKKNKAPRGQEHRVLTFDKLLTKTNFVNDMREILQTIHQGYNYPVDVEFTANYINDTEYRINLVQCRPLQVHGGETSNLPTVTVPVKDRLIQSRGAVVGHSRFVQVDQFIYVVPSKYGELVLQDRYEVGHLIGELNRHINPKRTVFLLGPGRWGTSTPQLGIPVNFAEICNISILCEIVAMHENLVPDVSLGTHFLNELVELDMLYLALFPDKGENYLNHNFFMESESQLLDILPSAKRWEDTVRVIDVKKVMGRGGRIQFRASALEQNVICYFDR